MVIAGLFLAAAAVTVWRISCARERPLDDAELELIRRFGDRTRNEQIHLFE